MKRNRLGILIFSLICVFILCACSSQATKDVIQKINSIETINESSGQQLNEIEQAYNELSDKEKQQVKNYDQYLSLTEEYESFMRVLHVKNLISSIDTISLETKEILDEIHVEYDALTDEEKSQVDNYDQLNTLDGRFQTYMQDAATKMAENIDSYNYEDRDTLAEEISIYYDYMTDEQKMECLCLHLYYQEVAKNIEQSLRDSVREPYSIVIKNMDITNSIIFLTDHYIDTVDIIYQIIGPEGESADIPDTVFLEFTVDIDTQEISFDKIYGVYQYLNSLL